MVAPAIGDFKIARNHLILIPVPLLVLAVFPMPYSFYGSLRGIVFMAACFLAEKEYRRKKAFNGWAIAFCCVGLLFNPIIPAEVSRSSWFILDLVAAGIFYVAWLNSDKPIEVEPPASDVTKPDN
jgi:hypothetical protein